MGNPIDVRTLSVDTVSALRSEDVGTQSGQRQMFSSLTRERPCLRGGDAVSMAV